MPRATLAHLAAVQFQLGTADFLTVLTIERTLYQSEDGTASGTAAATAGSGRSVPGAGRRIWCAAK